MDRKPGGLELVPLQLASGNSNCNRLGGVPSATHWGVQGSGSKAARARQACKVVGRQAGAGKARQASKTRQANKLARRHVRNQASQPASKHAKRKNGRRSRQAGRKVIKACK